MCVPVSKLKPATPHTTLTHTNTQRSYTTPITEDIGGMVFLIRLYFSKLTTLWLCRFCQIWMEWRKMLLLLMVA